MVYLFILDLLLFTFLTIPSFHDDDADLNLKRFVLKSLALLPPLSVCVRGRRLETTTTNNKKRIK